MVIRQRPYNLLLLTGLIFVIVSFLLINEGKSIDIHLHDTYFLIAHTHVLWFLASLSLFVWTVYLLTNKILFSKALTWAHVIITILTLILAAVTLYFGDSLSNIKPRRYYDYSNWNSFNAFDKSARTIGIALGILLCGQIIFIINFIMGIIKRENKLSK